MCRSQKLPLLRILLGGAFVLEKRIVYFGSRNKNTTFVIEKEEKSEYLKIVREAGFNLERLYNNNASSVFKNHIYAFKANDYRNVHSYSLVSGKWSLFYSYKWLLIGANKSLHAFRPPPLN